MSSRAPRSCENPNGTAPGLWLETRRNLIALLPGPPHEILPMFEKHVLPRLARLGRGMTVRRILRLTGIGESAMEPRSRTSTRTVPADVTVTTLATPGRPLDPADYSGRGPRALADHRLEALERELVRLLGPWIYSRTGKASRRSSGACSGPEA